MNNTLKSAEEKNSYETQLAEIREAHGEELARITEDLARKLAEEKSKASTDELSLAQQKLAEAQAQVVRAEKGSTRRQILGALAGAAGTAVLGTGFAVHSANSAEKAARVRVEAQKEEFLQWAQKFQTLSLSLFAQLQNFLDLLKNSEHLVKLGKATVKGMFKDLAEYLLNDDKKMDKTKDAIEEAMKLDPNLAQAYNDLLDSAKKLQSHLSDFEKTVDQSLDYKHQKDAYWEQFKKELFSFQF